MLSSVGCFSSEFHYYQNYIDTLLVLDYRNFYIPVFPAYFCTLNSPPQ